jgi:hypothetical protein
MLMSASLSSGRAQTLQHYLSSKELDFTLGGILDFAVIDSDQYCPSIDGATYGTGPEVRKFPWLNVRENYEDRPLTRGTDFSHDTMKPLMRTSAIWGPRYTGGSTRRVS